MFEDQNEWPTIELDHSPVSFVLMGPGYVHRRVLVRSKDSNMDLVGLDGTSQSPTTRRAVQLDLISAFLGKDTRGLEPLIVRSSPRHPIKEGMHASASNRFTHLSFAWRGLANKEDQLDIQSAFDNVQIDLSDRLIERSKQSIEWQLAPVILLCETATRRSLRRVRLIRFAIVLYIAVAVAALLYSKLIA